MKIRSLTLKNIGVFEDETISFPEKQDKDLAEIHILTGQNGTGKTTILQALASGVNYAPPFLTFLRTYSNEVFFKKFHNDKFIDDTPQVGINFDSKSIYFTSDGNFFSADKNRKIESIEPNKKIFTNDSQLDFIAFSYSGNRFIKHEDNINIREKDNYNPLEDALEFNKTYEGNNYTLNQWLANNISKSALAQKRNDKISRFDENIKSLERIINEIIKEDDDERGIQFDINYEENLKVVFIDKQGQELDFDLLPDGLRSIISWLGDLIMRMDALKWKDDLPIFEREFILFLDEIEVHLHPSWQRKILPVVQKLFKNAQIFITTHSPFIVNSVDGAWIYDLELNDGKVYCKKPILSKTSNSIDFILRKIFDVPEKYGSTTQEKLDKFYKDRTKIMNGAAVNKKEFSKNVQELLALESRTIEDIVHFELEQLGKEYSI